MSLPIAIPMDVAVSHKRNDLAKDSGGVDMKKRIWIESDITMGIVWALLDRC
jgi:hypothetical protein